MLPAGARFNGIPPGRQMPLRKFDKHVAGKSFGRVRKKFALRADPGFGICDPDILIPCFDNAFTNFLSDYRHTNIFADYRTSFAKCAQWN